MQHALQRAQALGITPQVESQQQHLSLPPRVLRLQQYGSGAGESSAFVLLLLLRVFSSSTASIM